MADLQHLSKKDKKLLDEIGILRTLIREQEKANVRALPKKLKVLRNLIMFTHQYIENGLTVFMTLKLIRWQNDEESALRMAQFYFDAYPMFKNMEFYNKLRACQEMNLIPGKLAGLLSKVNDHRKYFSHPESYDVKSYNNLEKYRNTLLDLHNARIQLDNSVAEYSDNPPEEKNLT